MQRRSYQPQVSNFGNGGICEPNFHNRPFHVGERTREGLHVGDFLRHSPIERKAHSTTIGVELIPQATVRVRVVAVQIPGSIERERP